MSEYLLINILIIIIPLIFSFEKNISFYKNIPNLLISVLIVSSIFIIWDSIATSRGDWGFNEQYVSQLKIFGLPLEEILFFITVPYSSIFIYETISFYINEKEFPYNKFVYLIIALLFIAAGMILNYHSYTSIVLIFCGVFFILSNIFLNSLLKSKIFWVTIIITYIPFLFINYSLTLLPIVIYNPNEILGLRVLTIPIEDFFYSFSMISLWILIYKFAKDRRNLFSPNVR